MSLLQFPRFLQLPPELRAMIWDFSLPAPPEVVSCQIIDTRCEINIRPPLPNVLRVAEEARHMARLRGYLWVSNDDRHMSIYFDPSHSILVLDVIDEAAGVTSSNIQLGRFVRDLPQELLPRVQHICVRLHDELLPVTGTYRRTCSLQMIRFLQSFSGLRSFIIQLDEPTDLFDHHIWHAFNVYVAQGLLSDISKISWADSALWCRFINLMISTYSNDSPEPHWWYRKAIYFLLMDIVKDIGDDRFSDHLGEEGAVLKQRIAAEIKGPPRDWDG